MMEDSWLFVDEDDSSNLSFADSDIIDSETEADLYSVIHYEQNLHNFKCPITETEIDQTSDGKKNESFAEKNGELVRTESVCSISPISKTSNDNNVINKSTSENVFFSKEAHKLNVIKEKKSDSIDKSNVSYSRNSEDIGITQSVKDAFLNNKRQRQTDYSSSKSPSLKKKNCTRLTDSSDSDSIIWTAVEASDRKEFQTNMFEDDDVVYLSSESESESQFNSLSLSKKSERNLGNLSMPNIKIGEHINDLWFINDQDLHRPKRSNSRRYHENVENTCTNCFGKGHNSRICPMPRYTKCFICGGYGHTGAMCLNRVCGRCFDIGHDSRRCGMPYINYCTLCTMRGHIKENCPDIWRRYHLTTHPGKIVHGKIINHDSLTYCWNCGQSGHFGAVCNLSRGLKNCLPTWPCVVSYDDPEDLLRKRWNGYSNRRGNFKRKAHSNQTFGVHLNQRNLTAGANLNQRNSTVGANLNVTKKNKKKRNKLNQLQKNLKKVMKELDFPRTPKNKNQAIISDDAVPEAVKQNLLRKQKRKEKNRKRRLKRRMEVLGKMKARENSLQTDM